MNTKITATLVLTMLVISFKAQTKKGEINVLFIGNSLTYYNDMPQILQKIFETQNLNYKISQSTYPGISLTQHLSRKAVMTSKGAELTPLEQGDTSSTVKLLQLKKWDFVVLQDGTVRLLIPEVKSLLVIPAIKTFQSYLKDSKAEIVLYRTWPTLDTFPKKHCYPKEIVDKSITKDMCCSSIMNNRNEEAKLINAAYDTVALATNLPTLPITNCFMEITANYPNINLYQDKSHPSKLGAYLIACICYKYLTKQKATTIKYNSDIDEKTAKIIKTVVDKCFVIVGVTTTN